MKIFISGDYLLVIYESGIRCLVWLESNSLLPGVSYKVSGQAHFPSNTKRIHFSLRNNGDEGDRERELF